MSIHWSAHRAVRPLLASLALFAWLLVTAPPAEGAPTWAPVSTATIHPGVQTYTEGAQCTANFVFFDASDIYIGQAAHCSGTGGATETNGCDSASHPIGTPVEVVGASRPGTLVYNSWLTMQTVGETDPNACQYNDFALVRLDPADHDKVNPSVPHWGGPSGLDADGTAAGERVYSYGNSSLRLGLTVLSPKTGVSLGSSGGGWTHDVYTVSPGVPGDSGSAFLSADGQAVGVLSTLQFAPLVGSNGVSDLNLALDYLAAHGSIDVELAAGTEPFAGEQLPLGGLAATGLGL
jgi:hypothetical protein